ncbi:polysaccharide biosynthesis/export family protein [soil metagenome]
MSRVTIFLIALFISMSLSSCYYNKRLVYFQNKNYTELKPTLVENKRPIYHLQPADILSVLIKSPNETVETSGVFNTSPRQNGMFASPGSLFLEGYIIDVRGKILIPVLGEVEVVGLTLEEAQVRIQEHAIKFLNKPTVIVKLTNFKVTVLGEVKNPGYFYVYNNTVTVLEALGLAGDLTPVASRKNIKLIRTVPDGSQVVLLDLTDPRLLHSDYFYLMPGDALYIEPLKARSKKSNLEVLGVVFSGITAAVLVLSYVNSVNP